MVNARFLVKKKNAKLVFRVAARLRAASGVPRPFFFLPARQTCDLFALSVPITPTARDVDSPVKVPPLFSRVKWPFTFFFFFKLNSDFFFSNWNGETA